MADILYRVCSEYPVLGFPQKSLKNQFEHYRQVASLKEYVLISQNTPKIERYCKTEHRRWIWDETDDEHPEIILESVGCRLNLDEIYDKVF